MLNSRIGYALGRITAASFAQALRAFQEKEANAYTRSSPAPGALYSAITGRCSSVPHTRLRPVCLAV